MKAVIFHQCTERAGRGTDLVTIAIECVVPFLPVPGMHISPSAESDYLKVADVYWKASDPDRVEVYMQPPIRDELAPLAYWVKQGWRRSP